MAETRRKFDHDFREGAVRLVRETGKPIAEVARDLGINAGTLGNWVNADKRRRGDGSGTLEEDERAELARLRRGDGRPGKGRWRAPDLVRRDFPAKQINRKWYGDGTEIGTGEGRLYLASVLDMASRRVLGFALSDHHNAELAYGALAMAVAVRGGRAPG